VVSCGENKTYKNQIRSPVSRDVWCRGFLHLAHPRPRVGLLEARVLRLLLLEELAQVDDAPLAELRRAAHDARDRRRRQRGRDRAPRLLELDGYFDHGRRARAVVRRGRRGRRHADGEPLPRQPRVRVALVVCVWVDGAAEGLGEEAAEQRLDAGEAAADDADVCFDAGEDEDYGALP
jgi:hypothetical protein